MDINQNNIDESNGIEINVPGAITTGYLKDVDTNLSSRLRHSNPDINVKRKLTLKTKIFYSLGHVYNDLTVSIWFSYTLLYFQFQFDDSLAGALILIGQFADAVASPFVGYHSDRSPDIWICRYGRRKTWHLLGVIMNTISVPFIYNNPCFPGNCRDSSNWARFWYYSVLIVIFQAGWAATQVSHVSLIVDLTDDTNERIALNAYRQAATIGANICLYTVTFFVIGFKDNSTLTENDLDIFTKVSYIVCGIGLVFALLFHVFVKEPEFQPKPRRVRPSVFTVETKRLLEHSRGSTTTMTLLAQNQPDTDSGRPSISNIPEPTPEIEAFLTARRAQKKWSHWLKSYNFWKITIMYTMARMFVNLSQVYTPLYLQKTLKMPKMTIAIIPFATYIAGLGFSFASKPISSRFGSRVVLIIGVGFGIASCAWMFVGDLGGIADSYKTWQIYGVSAFIGVGGTALLISSLALTSDLIGTNTSTGAFVFAAMSFFDKSVNGLVIAVLEHFTPKTEKPGTIGDNEMTTIDTLSSTASSDDTVPPVNYYKYILVSITGLSSVVVFLGLFTIIKTRYGIRTPRMSKSNSLASMH